MKIRLAAVLWKIAFGVNVVAPVSLVAVGAAQQYGLSHFFPGFFVILTSALTAVYWGVVFFETVPRTLWDAVKTLIPLLTGLIFMAVSQQYFSFWESLLANASAMYVGLTGCLLVGLATLAWRHRGRGVEVYELRDMAVVGLTFVAMAVSLALIGGAGLSSAVLASPTGAVSYGLQVVTLVAFFWPRLVVLYHEGKL